MTEHHEIKPGEIVKGKTEKIYRTQSGKILTDADFERLADEAEKGYDVDAILQRRSSKPWELLELRRIGDKMQSESSRLVEWAYNIEMPYEVRMAVLELKSAIDEWTERRRKSQ